mmetsp:Transcript_16137/g.46325  ORF Transcript_16137/g.46325 Transcript_16137/m.46325 type:complete len:220 (-) Transcript_16137:154-813(-)
MARHRQDDHGKCRLRRIGVAGRPVRSVPRGVPPHHQALVPSQREDDRFPAVVAGCRQGPHPLLHGIHAVRFHHAVRRYVGCRNRPAQPEQCRPHVHRPSLCHDVLHDHGAAAGCRTSECYDPYVSGRDDQSADECACRAEVCRQDSSGFDASLQRIGVFGVHFCGGLFALEGGGGSVGGGASDVRPASDQGRTAELLRLDHVAVDAHVLGRPLWVHPLD